MINERRAHEFCRDDISKIENYEEAVNDKTQTWICHHILGEILTRQQLLDHDFYYKVPSCMLKFVTKSEHNILHNKGKHHTDETKQRISDKLKGIKRGPMSEEHRRKLSESKKDLSAETRRKMSESQKGKHLSEDTRRKLSFAHKGHHHSEESRRKMSEAAKNRSKITEETRRKQSESHKGLRWKLIDGHRVYYRNEEDILC